MERDEVEGIGSEEIGVRICHGGGLCSRDLPNGKRDSRVFFLGLYFGQYSNILMIRSERGEREEREREM